MNTRKGGIRILMACALVILAVGVNPAGARPPVQDETYRDARLDSHRLTAVALLPAVAVADDPAAERLVELSWVALYAELGTRWMPADEVRARLALASGEPADLARAVNDQIWRGGEVEPGTAGRLAGLLGVEAVMSVRIDRWEMVDGGRAVVKMSAVLSGADGTRLWSISGLAGYGVPRGSAEQSFNADMSWIGNPDLEPGDRGHEKLGRALHVLLARWAWLLPESPVYAEGCRATVQPLAENQSD